MYEEKTEEPLDAQVLRKLELVKTEQGNEYPTNALILLSDDALRFEMFPNAKVECARFKGVDSEEFIDQKSIIGSIAIQAEEAYNFVLRHINKGAKIEGVYTVSRWEYPIKAIREIIRNAVVHRQYSLTGKDIKVAIYDDMVEITSPGLLPPSIDYADMESRQSDARNKVIAPVFKRLGIIDQWGNGLKLVATEMKRYPHVEFRWKEVGLSFQVQFIQKYYVSDVGEIGGNGGNLGGNGGNLGGNGGNLVGNGGNLVGNGGNLANVKDQEIKNEILNLIAHFNSITIQQMADKIGISKRNCERVIAILKEEGIIKRKGSSRTGSWIIINNKLR